MFKNCKKTNKKNILSVYLFQEQCEMKCCFVVHIKYFSSNKPTKRQAKLDAIFAVPDILRYGVMLKKKKLLFIIIIFPLLWQAVSWQEGKLERKRGGRDQDKSTSRDSNSGRPKLNCAIWRCAAHEAIGTDEWVPF